MSNVVYPMRVYVLKYSRKELTHMAYLEWFDKLPRWVKIVFAIVPPLVLFALVYRILVDFREKPINILKIVFDFVFGLPLGIVFYVLNLIWTIKDNDVFDFGIWLDEKEEKKEEPVEAEVVEEKK